MIDAKQYARSQEKKARFRRLDQKEEGIRNNKNYKNYIIGLN